MMAWMEHGLQISLRRYAFSVEDKMAAGLLGRARNYGLDGSFNRRFLSFFSPLFQSESYREAFRMEISFFTC